MAEVDKPVTLLASNQINVQVRGAPGGTLAVDIIGVDNDPPVITAVASPAANGASWNNSPVTVAFACSDATSGVAICPAPATVVTEGPNQIIAGQAVDKAGNTASASVTLNIDRTAPFISVAANPAPNIGRLEQYRYHFNFYLLRWPLRGGVMSWFSVGEYRGENAIDYAVGLGFCWKFSVGHGGDKSGQDATGDNNCFTDCRGCVEHIDDHGARHGDRCALRGGRSQLWRLDSDGCWVVVYLLANTCSGHEFDQVQASDAAGNSVSTMTTVAYVKPPQITITSPANSALFNQSPINVTGTVVDPAAHILVNGLAAPVSGNNFLATVPAQEGISTITAVVTNSDGSTDTASVQINLDTTPPHVAIYAPLDGSVTPDGSVTVTGLVNDIVVGTVNPQQATVKVNGVAAQVANRSFSISNIPLVVGPNLIHATAVDAAGNQATTTVTVVRQAGSARGESVLRQ